MKAGKKKAAKGKGTPAVKRRKSVAVAIKRVYQKPGAADGIRILIDRLWPRGVSKTELAVDLWPRDLAPTTELRKWYGHEPSRFAEFRRRYRRELAGHAERLAALRDLIGGRAATLITATREVDLSHATVLREMLTKNS
ncbi:MAG TPA: DUF488 family protein [Xanthobacteraceae bacterium]|jgi:uncharacterized protein YeaO (DUF488 family)|nr:DUF488 family protein [Xanthobacteraceae bacterium]